VPFAQLIQHAHDALSGQAHVGLDRQRIARVVVDHVEHPVRAAAGQGVAHEVYRPALVRAMALVLVSAKISVCWG